jgi:hypothetical protein
MMKTIDVDIQKIDLIKDILDETDEKVFVF